MSTWLMVRIKRSTKRSVANIPEYLQEARLSQGSRRLQRVLHIFRVFENGQTVADTRPNNSHDWHVTRFSQSNNTCYRRTAEIPNMTHYINLACCLVTCKTTSRLFVVGCAPSCPWLASSVPFSECHSRGVKTH